MHCVKREFFKEWSIGCHVSIPRVLFITWEKHHVSLRRLFWVSVRFQKKNNQFLSVYFVMTPSSDLVWKQYVFPRFSNRSLQKGTVKFMSKLLPLLVWKWAMHIFGYPAGARSVRARWACALRALGLLGAVHKWRHHFQGVARPPPSPLSSCHISATPPPLCHHVILASLNYLLVKDCSKWKWFF